MASAPKSSGIKSSGLRILQNGGWMMAPKTVGAILSIVYLAMIARSLGPDKFGVFALMFSFAQVVAGLASFQTWQMLIRYGTQPLLDGHLDKLSELFLICAGLDIAAFVFGMLLAAAGLFLLAPQFGWNGDDQLFIFLLSLILLLSARSTTTGLLRLFDDFKIVALAESIVPIFRFAGVTYVYFTGPNVAGYLMVWAASECLTAAILWGYILATKRLPFTGRAITEIFQYAARFPGIGRYALWSSVGSSLRFMNQQAIVVIVGFYTSAAAAGFFRLGHQLGQVLARIADGISLAFFLEFARVDAADGDRRAQSLVIKTLVVTIISAMVILILLLLIGRPAIVFAFGAEYLPAFPFVMVLGAAAAVQVAALTFEPVLLARGFAGRVIWANLTGAVSLAGFLALLLPVYASLGAAIAVLASAIVTAIAMGIVFRVSRNAEEKLS